jgi:hypothetical protein
MGHLLRWAFTERFNWFEVVTGFCIASAAVTESIWYVVLLAPCATLNRIIQNDVRRY